MKRMSLLLCLLVAGTRPAGATVRIVTSLQDFASIADAVGGKRVETFALAKGYQDPHFVEPKPSFILKLSKADLLIVAGLELEIGYLHRSSTRAATTRSAPAPRVTSTRPTAATSSRSRRAR